MKRPNGREKTRQRVKTIGKFEDNIDKHIAEQEKELRTVRANVIAELDIHDCNCEFCEIESPDVDEVLAESEEFKNIELTIKRLKAHKKFLQGAKK